MEQAVHEAELTFAEKHPRELMAERPVRLANPAIGLVLLGADLAIVTSIFLAASCVYALLLRAEAVDPAGAALAGFGVAGILVLMLAGRGCYAPRQLMASRRQAIIFAQSWLAAVALILWTGFITKMTGGFSRGTLLLGFIPGLGVALLMRSAVLHFITTRMTDGRLPLRSVFLIHAGDDGSCDELLARLVRHGVCVGGVHHIPPARLASTGALLEAVTACQSALALAELDAVYLALPWSEHDSLGRLRKMLTRLPLPVLLLLDPQIAAVIGQTPVDAGGMSGFELQRAPLTIVERIIKRALDVVIAGSALMLLSILLGAIALAVLVTSGRPVLFRQARRGLGGRRFNILKFRTMSVQENGHDIRQAVRNDPRVTAIGAVLRRLSLDELPQLWNVVRGDMSLIGPRPHALAHDLMYDRVIATYAFRHHVKPGITGWAQINGHRGETREVSDMDARVQHDLWYINNFSIWLDVRILVRTATMMFFDREAY